MRKTGSPLAHVGVNIFFIIGQKMYPAHKRIKSGPETMFYFFKFQRFKCFAFEYISFSTGPALNLCGLSK